MPSSLVLLIATPPRAGFFIAYLHPLPNSANITPNRINPLTQGRNMPTNDPHNWSQLANAVPPAIWGAFMAVIIAVLRVLYDNQETNRVRIWLEAAICGCLSLSASAVVEFMGAPAQAAIAVGGAIGFVGVTKLRQVIMAWLDRSTPKQ